MKIRLGILAFFVASLLSCGGSGDSDDGPSVDCSNFSVTATQIDDATAGNDDGSVVLVATGGSGVYRFSLDAGTTFQTDGLVSGLAAGDYTALATDNQGCSATVQFSIGETSIQAPSFDSVIEPLFIANCAISGCHVDGGTAPFIINGHASVASRAGAIRTRVSNGTMPPAGPLPQSEIDLIVAWVDGGAPDN